MTGTLKVTPERLISTASDFSSKGGTIAQLTSQMTSLVVGLASIWEGEAANLYINKFRQLDDDIQRINRMVQEHVTDLNEMAGAYQRAEDQSISDFESLATDVIV